MFVDEGFTRVLKNFSFLLCVNFNKVDFVLLFEYIDDFDKILEMDDFLVLVLEYFVND